MTSMTQAQAQARTLGGTLPSKPSALRQDSGLIIVCMGPSGAGKTTLLETLTQSPAYTPVAVFDIDGKAHVLRDIDNLDVYPAHDWDTLDHYVQELEKQSLHPVYNTVAFDGLTLLQVASQRKQNVQKIDNPQLRQGAFGRANDLMVDLAQRVRILSERGTNIIFNVWSWAEKEDEQDTYKKILPDVTATMQNKFLGQFDFVVYLEPNNPPRPYPPIMRTGGSPKYGTRMAVSPDSPLRDIPTVVYNPSYTSILDSFHGKDWPTDKHAKQ